MKIPRTAAAVSAAVASCHRHEAGSAHRARIADLRSQLKAAQAKLEAKWTYDLIYGAEERYRECPFADGMMGRKPKHLQTLLEQTQNSR